MAQFKKRDKPLHTMKKICEMNGVAYDETRPMGSDALLKLLGVSSEDELKTMMFGDLYVHYPEWVETYEDTQGCCFEEGCTLGYDKGRPEDEPTEEEWKEFNDWCNKVYDKGGN